MPRKKRRVIRHAAIVRVFAERLRELRRTRGLTQVALSQKAGIPPSYLSKLEAGGSAPGIDLVGRLADALGVSAPELLSYAPPVESRQVLREQARRLCETVIEAADDAALASVNVMMALFAESLGRKR